MMQIYIILKLRYIYLFYGCGNWPEVTIVFKGFGLGVVFFQKNIQFVNDGSARIYIRFCSLSDMNECDWSHRMKVNEWMLWKQMLYLAVDWRELRLIASDYLDNQVCILMEWYEFL
jgi:hypothetical protein